MDEVFGLLKEQFQQHQVSLARASKREQLDPGNVRLITFHGFARKTREAGSIA